MGGGVSTSIVFPARQRNLKPQIAVTTVELTEQCTATAPYRLLTPQQQPANVDLDFHGLPLPEGKEKRVLYQSSFRTLATYAMPLADLDSEMRKLLSIRNLTAEADERKDFVGKFCVTTKSEGGTTVNVLMDRCDVGDSGNGLVVSQLKYWIDF